ncbi:Holliday junction resolvase RuvX [Cerasicoccus frondis]|uniref:Holliday junction resolvase RuvX n=1 Tax=Cerasicoccus frondis TaxID=490090 RepID=UPI0028528EE1|nr:Holliday junction resolvase RuvX [Cerasicoccus frondis]
MNFLGIDYGEKRIGLSAGDDDVRLAVPIPAAVEPMKEARLAHIAQEIKQRRIGALVVGYPYNMDGSVGFKAQEVDAFIQQLESKFGLPVYRTDERLTSQAAESQMRANKPAKSRSKKSIKAKQQERRSGNLDSRAAALILQDYLDGGMAPLLPEDELE